MNLEYEMKHVVDREQICTPRREQAVRNLSSFFAFDFLKESSTDIYIKINTFKYCDKTKTLVWLWLFTCKGNKKQTI